MKVIVTINPENIGQVISVGKIISTGRIASYLRSVSKQTFQIFLFLLDLKDETLEKVVSYGTWYIQSCI